MKKSTPKFMSGMKLNKGFYKDVAKPLLQKHAPHLKYAAGLVGNGSDVLGFDTPTSMDHNWGPRLVLFLEETDFEANREEVDTILRLNLPYEYKGYSTNYTDPQYPFYLDRQPLYIDSGPVNHYIQIFTIKSFFEHFLAFDPYQDITYADWLTFPEQALIEVTAGEVFHDDIGLSSIRKKFAYYPNDVWMYIYWAQWDKIANEEAFVGRAVEVKDELGAHIITSHIVSYIIKLSFLMEKQYMPYNKWSGYAFSRLKSDKKLGPILLKVLSATSAKKREEALGQAYQIIAKMHNKLKITEPMQTDLTDYNGRPYNVIHAGKVNKMVFEKLSPKFKKLKHLLGSVDQFTSHARIHHMGIINDKFKEFISDADPMVDKGKMKQFQPVNRK